MPHASQMESPNIISLLRHTLKKPSKTTGLLRMFKLLPMLSAGSRMAALLRRPRPLLPDRATATATLFGPRHGRLVLAMQDDPHRPPAFLIELPILMPHLQREMSSDVLRLALETDTKTAHKRRLLEEFVWAVYCNGRKVGYSIRRREMTDEEALVMRLLRGVSMGAGVLSKGESCGGDGEMTYIRARFDRVVGSRDSESFYMINPDGGSGQELSIFFLRVAG